VTAAYAPVSTCDRACLPPAGAVARAGGLRRAGRLAALAGVLVAGLALAAVLTGLRPATRARAVRAWFRAVLRAAGVRLVVRGGQRLSRDGTDPRADRTDVDEEWVARPGTLVVANHISWLDIPALLAVEPLRVLAKSDVRGWPVLGGLAHRAGTLFIDRARLRRLPATVAEVATALRTGHSVLVFPAGTTRCGDHRTDCRPALFQAAADAGAPVRLVRLDYGVAGAPTAAPAFLADDPLLTSVRRVVAVRGLVAEVTVGGLRAGDRRSMAHAATAFTVGQAPLAIHRR
jgi:1-acyl-sn-glycerol-3-phosphate acyltransferase